jgi:hypothetical protein
MDYRWRAQTGEEWSSGPVSWQQQPDMPASAYKCPRCAGARRDYHSTDCKACAKQLQYWLYYGMLDETSCSCT